MVVLESHEAGWAASGRNGGFCAASLTHGTGNGLARWPDDMPTLLRLGRDNLDGIEATLDRYRLDVEWERSGALDVATAPWQAADLRAHAEEVEALGESVELLDTDEVRGLVNSPTYHAGLLDRTGTAMVHPAKLAWGLREACLSLGCPALRTH